MNILFGIFAVILAVSLFLVNFSLGVFKFLDIPSFSSEENNQVQTVLEGLAEQIEEGKQNLVIDELKKTITAPTPLKVFQKESQGSLTTLGVFAATNAQRQQNGLSALSGNATLDIVAEAKVNDMFELQYFEHESPTGILFTHLAEQFGYEYLSMGENLALGNYESEEVLVQAWMDSPGHRANILNAKYSEIGLAVKKGLFNGQEVWLAVQTFALPLSVCPSPDEDLKAEIELKKVEIKELQILVDAAREELRNTSQKQSSAYQKKIDEFNALVEQYNKAVLEVQTLVSGYNMQVEVFNACADSKNGI
jgi:uncharacterized protein YkwD